MNRRVGFFYSVVFFALAWPMGEASAAPPVKVCVGDAYGQKCVETAPAGSSADSSARIIRILLNQAREALRDLRENGRAAGSVAADIKELDKLFKELQKRYAELERSAKSGEWDAKDALKGLAEARKELGRHRDELKALWEERVVLAKRVKRLEERRRLNLELSVLGGAAWNYGATMSPLAVSLVLPLGEDGLWKTRLTAGLGLSPSAGLGLIAMGTLTRSLGRTSLELGPAVLGLGDVGDLLGDTRAWVLAGGLQLRVKQSRGYISVTPFVGVTVKRESNTIWHPAEYKWKQTDCGPAQVLVREAWQEDLPDSKRLAPAVGALFSFGYVLF